MSTDLGASFNEQFMNINTKLKKRFMRKPNISEATNEFIALAIQCEHSEQPAFAGHAYVGAAKCEATAGNFLGEAEQYIAAARQFMKEEQKLKALKFYSPDRENLEAAIGSYMQAYTKYPEKSTLRTSILLELAENLISLNLHCEALVYYEQAVNTIDENSLKMTYMGNLLNLQIDCCKYDIALETANKICDSKTNLPEAILSEIQVSRILLSLLVQPSEDTQPVSLKQLFADLMNDNDSEALPFNPELRLKLQSLVAASATSDIAALVVAASDIRRHILPRHAELLQALLDHLLIFQ